MPSTPTRHPGSSLYPPSQRQSPLQPTPMSIVEIREPLRRARNQQLVETDAAMMRQRSLLIMDLASEIMKDRNERMRKRGRR
eukprot:4250040-Pleurochrysis_carterae.AAC.1